MRSQSVTEKGYTWAKNECGASKKDAPFLYTIVQQMLCNQSKDKPLLTDKQFNILMTNQSIPVAITEDEEIIYKHTKAKLAKYTRQALIMVNSNDPILEQTRIALAYHIEGSKDMPANKL